MEKKTELNASNESVKPPRKSSGKRSNQIRPRAERRRAVELYCSGKTKAEVARTLNIPESTLRGWIKDKRNSPIDTSGEIDAVTSSESWPRSCASVKMEVQEPLDEPDEYPLVIDMDYSGGELGSTECTVEPKKETSEQQESKGDESGEAYNKLLNQALLEKEERRRLANASGVKRKRPRLSVSGTSTAGRRRSLESVEPTDQQEPEYSEGMQSYIVQQGWLRHLQMILARRQVEISRLRRISSRRRSTILSR